MLAQEGERRCYIDLPQYQLYRWAAEASTHQNGVLTTQYNSSTYREDILHYVDVRGPKAVLERFDQLRQQPEFQALKMVTEKVVFPDSTKAPENTNDEYPGQRLARIIREGCEWSGVDKDRVLAWYWDAQARGWFANIGSDVRNVSIPPLVVVKDALTCHDYPKIQRVSWLILGTPIAAAVSSLWGFANVLVDYSEGERCREYAKALKGLHPNLKTTDFPRLLKPAVERIQTQAR